MAAAQEPAAASCVDFQEPDEFVKNITAECTDAQGNLQPTSISLGECLVNIDGIVSCQDNGRADRSCFFSGITQSGDVLTIQATCNNDNNVGHNQIFTLGDCLANSNGVLTCSS
ncbi:hypothetical protein GGX14DRAFT_442733 [Mycena pura]|uniref:Cyanovirin-N domain-containing protein n=1 Tax=Mycena pura TaxID=153505 RepID=A0AAD6VMH1_9AGAR|nr:hypothetical protein GGX14DRAFT_442733 [Mycena pura]